MRALVTSFLTRLRGTTGSHLRLFISTRQPVVWAMAVIIGAGVAGAAILFRLAIGWVQLLWLGTTSERVTESAAALPAWVVLAAPAAGGVVVGIILVTLLPSRRAGNVADVIEAKTLHGGYVDLRTGLVSAVVSAISLGAGASAGREGPVVHLGATLASFVSCRLGLPRAAVRTLLGCGVAAAVAASFNAPLAGVLFALEVILGHYALSAFVPIVIASVVATVCTRLTLGDFQAFVIPQYEIMSFYEFPAFALLGLVCAAVAILFQFALIGTDRVAREVPMPIWARPIVGGLMVGAIGIFLPEVLGVGYGATDDALKQQIPLLMLLVLLVAKTAATAITLASRFGGGVFSPSLYLGAMAGGAFGLIAASVFPEQASSHGLYALIGMGGVAAAVLGAPISTTLIVFELTGGFEVAIALMLAVSISTGLTQAVHGRSFFHWQLETRGLALTEGSHRTLMLTLRVRDFMTEARAEEPTAIDGDDTPRLVPGDSLERALRLFDAQATDRIPVVAPDDRETAIGWASRVRALDVFNKALIDAHVEEHR